MSTPAYINASNMSKGPANAEASINLQSVTHRLSNPKHTYSDRFGGVLGFAYDYNITYEADVSGEINTSAHSAVMGATHGAAFTFANAGFPPGRQFRFPRSKKRRIRRKWAKDPKNYRPAGDYFLSNTVVSVDGPNGHLES